jgi:hypothetical protein
LRPNGKRLLWIVPLAMVLGFLYGSHLTITFIATKAYATSTGVTFPYKNL